MPVSAKSILLMRLENKQDHQLVKLYMLGQEAGLLELLDRYKSRVYATIFHLVRDRDLTEDIFQDTFIKVIDTLKRGKYNEEGKFLSWVTRIAHNLVIDHFRKEKRTSMVIHFDGNDMLDNIGWADEDTEIRMIREQSRIELRRLIQQLPDDQKEVLLMRHYGEMSFKEIADVTQVSINTALGRMRYAINNLRKMMVAS